MARALRLSTALLAAWLLLAAGARAAPTCESAPGTSGLDQYCETLPGAGGGSPSIGGSPGEGPGAGGSEAGSSAGQEALPPAAARGLSQPGDVNAGIRRLVDRGPAHGQARRGKRKPAVAPAAEGSSDPLSAVTNSVKDGPTVSSALPPILLVLAILAASIAWLRNRDHGRSR